MKRSILAILTLGFFYLTLSSHSSGVAVTGLNRTGAGGSANNCAGAGCHPDNTSDLSISIIMIDPADGDTITTGKYQVGKVYRILLSGNYSQGGLPKFGFQCTAAKDNGAGAGEFILATSGVQKAVVGNYQIVEQSHSLDATGSFNQRYEIWFNWYPTAAYGNVTFFATMLAADDNGFSNGDITNNESRTIQQGPLSVAALDDDIKTTVYPNPVQDQLNISILGAGRGVYELKTYNINGQQMERKTVQVTGNSFETSFNTSSWAPGTYLLHIINGDAQRIITIIKK